MTIGLIEDLITSTSLADLRSERDRQAQRVEEVKHRRDNILQELTVANGSYLMAQQMVAIKEAMEPKPAQSPTKESSNGDSPTGRESVLQVIREKPGLRPQGIRDAGEGKVRFHHTAKVEREGTGRSKEGRLFCQVIFENPQRRELQP